MLTMITDNTDDDDNTDDADDNAVDDADDNTDDDNNTDDADDNVDDDADDNLLMMLMVCLCSLKSCFTGLQQLTALEVWSTFNDHLQRLTDVNTKQCL